MDRYASIKRRNEFGYEMEMHFMKVHLSENDRWIGQRVADLKLPSGMIIAIIKRREEMIIPRGDVILLKNDTVVLGAEPFDEQEHISLKEIVLRRQNPWTGQKIKDLDISRQSIIVMVKRKNKSLIPNGNMVLLAGDRVFLYTKLHLSGANEIEI